MKKIIDRAIELGIEDAEIFYLNNVKEDVKFENDQLKTVNASQNAGVALRTVKNGKMGYVTSSNIDDVDKIAKNALEVTKFSPQKEFDFTSKVENSYKDYSNKKVWDIPMEQLIEHGHKAIEIIKKYDDNILVSVGFSKEKQGIKIVNTRGVDIGYEKDSFTALVSGNLIQGTNFIECSAIEKNLSGKYDISELAEKTIRKISIARQECSFNPGNKTVILTPTVLTQILITLQRGVNGSLVEKGISPLCGKIGEKIFSDKISLVDDGTMEDGISSMAFDDEGTMAQKTVIIENGILKSYIHSLKTAAKLGFEPTGNGLKNQNLFSVKKFDIMPKPDITNWVMKPGDVKYEDMVSEIKDGVIIDDIMGIFMNNLENGDFAGNIGMGYVIKNGKIAGRLKDAAICANIYDVFLNNVVALSDKVYKASLFDFIGTHKMPYLMLKDINIAAKK